LDVGNDWKRAVFFHVDRLAGQALCPLYDFLRAWKHAYLSPAYTRSAFSVQLLKEFFVGLSIEVYAAAFRSASQ
jgi:hypothetical protein